MSLKTNKLIATFTGLFFLLSSHCQKHFLKTDNFQSSNGLINNHVLCTFQDSRGLLWIGTYSGVQTFDGSNFELFNINKNGKNSFTNHVVLSIAEDKEHNLWFGTEWGLNKYNVATGAIKQFVSHSDSSIGLQHNYIKDIVIDDEGLIWLGTYGGGLIVYDEANDVFEQYQSIPNDSTYLECNLINSLLLDDRGRLWIATEHGTVSVFDRQKRKVSQRFSDWGDGTSDNIVNCIFQDYYGNFWFGTWSSGLIKYDPKLEVFRVFESMSEMFPKKNTTVKSIEQTEKDFLWIGTYGEGVYKFYIDNEKFHKVDLGQTDNRSSKQEYVWQLFKDDKNDLWISTFGAGIFMINPRRNKIPSYVIRSKQDNSRISISCFVEDNNNQIWIGTYTSGIYIFNPKTKSYTKFKTCSKLGNRINCLYVDSNNNIWAGSENCLLMLKPDRKQYNYYEHNKENDKSLSNASINTILEDNSGNIWIGTWGKGINVLSKEELQKSSPKNAQFEKYSFIKNSNSITNNNIWKLYKDSRGNIWIATADILTYYIPSEKTFTPIELHSVSSFYETKSGDIWVTPMGSGVSKLDKNFNIVKNISIAKGASSLALVGIMADSQERLWVGSNKGLFVIEPETETIINFDKNYGLEFNEVNLNAYAMLQSGKFAYGGNEGFNIFFPELQELESFDGNVFIDNIKVLHKPYDYNKTPHQCKPLHNTIDSIHLNYDYKVITINFSSIDYFNSNGIIYTYLLEGFDKDWIVTNANNKQATYTNLPPGEYVFKVTASYNEKNRGTQQAKLYIKIKKPIWMQAWFKLCAAVLILSILFKLASLKLNHEKRKLKLNKEKELLHLQNEALNESLNKNNEKIVSLAFNNLNSIDKIKIAYQNLKQMEDEIGNKNNRHLKQTLKILQPDSEKQLHNDTKFENTVNQIFDDFQKRLSIAYPKLTHKDLRICSYIRMNKPNKEIAQHLNITTGSLETSRYRIRKKLELGSEINLNDFLIKY